MPTRRGPTWEAQKELQMQQALHKRLDSWLRFQKPAKEKTQQSRPRDSIRELKAREQEGHGQGDKEGKAR